MRSFLPYLLVLFLVAAVLRVDFFFTIAYLFFLLYLLSRLWTQRTSHSLRVERRFTQRAFFGDQVTVEVTVRNAGPLPIPWVEVHESLPVNLISPPLHREALSLGAREQRRFQYTLHCQQRGYYPIGPLHARTGDVLGIEAPRTTQAAPDHLTVYPHIISLARLRLPTHSPLVALPARSPLFEDPARVTGVRDYERGDSPRRIHWTATASAGRLLVKQYLPAIARETLICLNLNEADYELRHRYDAVELAITAAASIANHIVIRERLPVGLVTEARDSASNEKSRFFLPPRPERAHLTSLLEVLARAQVVPATPLAELLRQESVRLAWGATLVVITGREDEALFDTLAYLRRVGFAVALTLVQAASPSIDLQGRADLLGVPVHRLWRERDLEQWQ
jgi:uncharacterized repeat protein (TIGR01451 family)